MTTRMIDEVLTDWTTEAGYIMERYIAHRRLFTDLQLFCVVEK